MPLKSHNLRQSSLSQHVGSFSSRSSREERKDRGVPPRSYPGYSEAGVKYSQGRWSKEEHYRFIEALKLFGKEWRRVQQHVATRTSTQARSHAQKFFVKLEKRRLTLDEFLAKLDLERLK